MNNKKGFSELMIIGIAVLALLLAGFGYWYYASSNLSKNTSVQQEMTQMPELSESTDEAIIESELDATVDGDIEQDFVQFDKDLNSL